MGAQIASSLLVELEMEMEAAQRSEDVKLHLGMVHMLAEARLRDCEGLYTYIILSIWCSRRVGMAT